MSCDKNTVVFKKQTSEVKHLQKYYLKISLWNLLVYMFSLATGVILKTPITICSCPVSSGYKHFMKPCP